MRCMQHRLARSVYSNRLVAALVLIHKEEGPPECCDKIHLQKSFKLFV